MVDVGAFLERHPHAVLPLIGTFVGIFPAFSFPELAWDASGLRTGLVIGTVLAIAPITLFCVRRTRTWGATALALAGSLAIGCLYPSANPLTDPGVVEFRSTAATFVSWTAAAVYGAGIAHAIRTDRGQGHLGWVEVSGEEYRAGCDCGWRGPVDEETAAFAEAGEHANRVSLRVRPWR